MVYNPSVSPAPIATRPKLTVSDERQFPWLGRISTQTGDTEKVSYRPPVIKNGIGQHGTCLGQHIWRGLHLERELAGAAPWKHAPEGTEKQERGSSPRTIEIVSIELQNESRSNNRRSLSSS